MIHVKYPVPLVAQRSGADCFQAAAEMLLAWQQRRAKTFRPRARPTTPNLPNLHIRDVTRFARALGLTPLVMSPTPSGLAGVLRRHGPLWYAGFNRGFYPLVQATHAVVITGVQAFADGTGTVWLHDPLPVDRGRRDVVSNFSGFFALLQPISTVPFLRL